MSEVNNIVLLVERLQEENEMELSEVQQLLEPYPGWSRWVDVLATEGDHFGPRSMALILGTQAGAPGLVRPKLREVMLSMLLPYALLLDERRAPIERAAQLIQQIHVDIPHFCEECFRNEDPEIVTAAQTVLAAFEAEHDLLRGADRPQDQAKELLRPPVSSPVDSGSLLRASAENQEESKPPHGLHRLWNLLRGKTEPPG
jgi:hypothetical protein